MRTTAGGNPAPHPDEKDVIVTFYSYKGGVGRTMAVANVAWILASAGKKVLVVDWDLESPGLHRYLHPYLRDKTLGDTDGVVDMVRGYTVGAFQDPDADLPTLRRHFADVHRYAVPLVVRDYPGWGAVDFLGPGRQNDSYEEAVASLPWSTLFSEYDGIAFFAEVRASMRSGRYDYVLVDSRTGLSDNAAICTKLLPDVVVVGFMWSSQAIEGAAAVIDDIEAGVARKRPIRVLPVPMRVESGEHTKLNASRAYARSMFPGLPRNLDDTERESYWDEVEVPYSPFYAYEEVLAAFGDRPGAKGTLLTAYEHITSRITNGDVDRLRPLPEAERLRQLARWERVLPRTTTAAVVAAPRGRMWADWVRTELGRVGVTPKPLALPPEPGFSAAGDPTLGEGSPGGGQEQVIAVLTADLPATPEGDMLARVITARYRPGVRTVPGVIGVRADNATLPQPFDLLHEVRFEVLDEDAARAALLRPLGLTGMRGAPTSAPAAGGTRYPNNRPEVWEFPAANTLFVGRETYLSQIRDHLGWLTSAPPFALCGPPGHGKTQIAVEYLHRFAADYDVVWWVRASQRDTAWQDLDRLATKLVADTDLAAEFGAHAWARAADRVAAMLDAFAGTRPGRRWLLVYDDVGDSVSLSGLLPPVSTSGHVLVTSPRDEAAWRGFARTGTVREFSQAESLQLVRLRTGLADLGTARASNPLTDLLQEIGYHPQAVDSAAAWMAQQGLPAAEAAREYKNLLDRALEDMSPGDPDDPALRVLATWSAPIDRLELRSKTALRLVEMCAFLAPDISTKLLMSSAMVDALASAEDKFRDMGMTSQIFGELTQLALAQADHRQQTLRIHPIVQEALRHRMARDGTLEERRAEVLLVLAAYAPSTDVADTPADNERLIELLRHVEVSGALSSNDRKVREWLVIQVRFLVRSANATTALRIGEPLLKRWATMTPDGERDVLRLRLATHVANAYRARSRLVEATNLDEDTHALLLEALGYDHPFTLCISAQRGADLRALGRFQDARDEDQAVYEGYRRMYGDDDRETLRAAQHLAHCLYLSGAPRAALDRAAETFERTRRILGIDHPLTWEPALALGLLQRQLGDLERSAHILRQARKFFDDARMPLDRAFADRLLAATLRLAGDADAARKFDQDALRAYLATPEFGEDHIETVACVVSLANDLHTLGRHDEAVRRGRRALELYRGYAGRLRSGSAEPAGRTNGPDHPFEFLCMANLSVYLRGAGEVGEALELSTAALAGLSADDQVGQTHFFTFAVALGHANTLVANGELETARDLDERTHAALDRFYTAAYPDTKIARHNLEDSRARLSGKRGHPTTPGGPETVQDRLDSLIEMPVP